MSARLDRNWPRASEWLAKSQPGGLTVIGAPVCRGSITPGHCDQAPAAIRAALIRFSTYDIDNETDLLEVAVRDLGDLPVSEMSPEQMFAPVRDAIANAPRPVVLLGGDNSITRPGVHAMGGLAHTGLITIDAHFDLRDLDGGLTNGNPVRALLRDGLPGPNVVQIGIQSFANSGAYARIAREAGITVISCKQTHEIGLEESLRSAFAKLAAMERIYVDLDLDVMDRGFAPATPGSRPGGVTPWELRMAARMCGLHPKVQAMDVVEMDPSRDVADVTAFTAAACLLEFAAGFARRKQ
ncbi:MAG: agmatinase family protein [Bryobacteraceae bacterium]|nr:agmatinase family protein [Bryobacteraceae bacterium]